MKKYLEAKRDLSKLSLRYQRFGKNWKDTKTGEVISDSKITNYIPNPVLPVQDILDKRWDLKY